MSVSSLQAQLAALNGSAGKHPGSSFGTSKRHEDAIGRGLHYSVQHGHAVQGKFYHASLLAATAKEAADVPLQALTENCQTALAELSAATTMEREGAFLLDMRSKICGSDQAPHKTVQELLVYLTTVLAEESEQHSVACWHVLEFLLRKYSLHVHHMEDLLWTLLPTATRYPAIFARCLQLVDLAAHPSYLWLRPYAATESQRKDDKNQKADSSDTPSTVPPRPLLARHVVQKTDLLRRVCRLASAVADWHSQELHTSNHARRGIAAVLSFTAALIVEGLAQQQQNSDQMETILRTAFSTVVAACGSQGGPDDWRGWGYVVASVLAETADLSPKATATLTTRMVSAVATQSLDRQADAMAAVLSVLQQQPEASLPLVNGHWLGCLLPAATRDVVLQQTWMADALGLLHRDRRIVVAPFVAALLVASGPTQGDIKGTALALALIRNKSLDSLWTRDARLDLTASLAAWIVQEQKTTHKAVLEELQEKYPAACERGIGLGIQTDNGCSKMQLRELLDGIVPLGPAETRKDTPWEFLPPRVAMEHADASVRQQAIERLRSAPESYDSAEDLTEAFFRRLVSDENVDVAIAACDALLQKLARGNALPVSRQMAEWTQWAGYRWMNESMSRPADEKLQIIFCKMLLACAHVAHASSRDPNLKQQQQLLVEFIVAHLDHSLSSIARSAQEALFTAYDKTMGKMAIAKMNSASHELVSKDREFWKSLSNGFSHRNESTFSTEAGLRKRCALVLINGSISTNTNASVDEELMRAVHSLCVLLIRESSSSSPDAELDVIKKGLEWSAEKLPRSSLANEDVVKMVLSLASSGSETIFQEALRPTLLTFSESVKDGTEQPVSPVSVILEAATRPKASTKAMLRLISIVKASLSDKKVPGASFALLPALFFIDHPEKNLRDEAAKLLEVVAGSLPRKSRKQTSPDWSTLLKVCDSTFGLQSTSRLLLGSVLPEILSSSVGNSADGEQLQENLLLLCFFSAVSCGSVSAASTTRAAETGWLSLSPSTGGSCVATKILDAMENSGEQSFPLLKRWRAFGRPITEHVVKSSDPSCALPGYMDSVVRMLKGTMITYPPLIISSGPGSTGRRARSYSFGNREGVTSLKPYPKDMVDTIANAFSQKGDKRCTRELSVLIARRVLASTAWQEDVFKNLTDAARVGLARTLLLFVHSAELSDEFFSDFPLCGGDLLFLLRDSKKIPSLLLRLTDFIRSNRYRLASDSGASELSVTLFSVLRENASIRQNDPEDYDEERSFANSSILLSLSQLWETAGLNLKLSRDQLDMFLLDISIMLGCSEMDKMSDLEPLTSPRARYAAQSLLAVLCERHPTEAVPYLIPAILSDILFSIRTGRTTALGPNTFMRLLPVFLNHAPPTGLPLRQLLTAFFTCADRLKDKRERKSLYHAMVNAIFSSASAIQDGAGVSSPNASVGGFIASYIAHEIGKGSESLTTDEACDFSTDILSRSPDAVQAASSLLLIQYVKGMLSALKNRSENPDLQGSPDDSSAILSVMDTLLILFAENAEENLDLSRKLTSVSESGKIRALVHGIMKVCYSVLTLPKLRKYVRRSDSNSSCLPLQIWQDLLVVQSIAQIMATASREGVANQGEDSWQAVSDVVNKCCDVLQHALPVTVFLASTSSIIEDGKTDEIRARAFRLAAGRALRLESNPEEAELFLDLVPLALKVVGGERQGTAALKQSGLIAIEHIARSWQYLSKMKERDQSSALKLFECALLSSCHLLQRCTEKLTFEEHQETQLHEMICSAALCSAALVQVIAARCLPALPKVMNGIIVCLRVATTRLRSVVNCTRARLVELSALRALVAIAETVPQFLPPYLPSLLSSSAILASSLRSPSEPDEVVGAALGRLDEILSSKLPPRVLLSVAAKRMQESCLAVEMEALLSILKVSVDKGSNSEIAAQTKPLLLSITSAFEHTGPVEERTSLIECACTLLHSFVLKLSELQLRRLFASLKEWCGKLDTLKPDLGAEKRFAYWRACCTLSKTLRSIFFPCLSMAWAEAISELEVAARFMNSRKSETQKLNEGKKRRRLDDTGVYGIEAMRTLQPLLLCLEHSLKADAHQGGAWIRSEGNQKYESLVEPLGKLLQAQMASDFPVSGKRATAFQQVVQGAFPDEGNLVGCLTALASAGGSEQLWKPLNYALLEACGNEWRSEVRKAGLLCLLSIMRSLGEEYMVLLPECLPVLSELLEDNDEEVCGLAKEVVTLAEELTGESLEDSLR